ncbi:unnamed protein product, partial [Symbiodinium necroappetens]
VEVVDLESEASTAGTPRGLKRKASFQTPSPKKRLFEEGSQALQVRQIEQLKKTIEKDSPAYYRLDYLWGKTPEKEAQPGLKPDTASQRQQKQQEQNRQSLEARASQAVEELGLQPVIKVVRQKKAGRPPGSQNKVKPVPTLRKRRADVPAKAKLGMMAELDRLAIEKASKRQARLQLMKQYGVSETFCWNLQRSAKRQKVSNFVAKAATGSTGARQQHILTAGDVLLDFEDRLEAAIALRQAEETAGTLDKTGQVELAAMRQKRDTLTKNKRQRDKYQVKLLAKCGLRSRACQQTANLSAEEEKARLETAWKKGSTAKAKAEARQAAGPQAVRHYFNADRQPLGAVMPTILVVYGKHCRLENISQAGTWVKSEKFQIGSKLVKRKAGKPVPGSLMRSWRKLRATQPELFADGSIRVWSQPAAVVDSVIYRWQLEMEAEEHRQAVQLVDMFAAAWTEDSMHAAALLQRAQTGIAAGCTGLTQVTDTGFGQPAKAALARWQEELKQRMREKARQQKVHCTYRTGPQDILQAARQMHARMVEINETDSTILRCMRQAGWFRFRPDSHGLLQDCGSQSWCQSFSEGSDKL